MTEADKKREIHYSICAVQKKLTTNLISRTFVIYDCSPPALLSPLFFLLSFQTIFLFNGFTFNITCIILFCRMALKRTERTVGDTQQKVYIRYTCTAIKHHVQEKKLYSSKFIFRHDWNENLPIQ